MVHYPGTTNFPTAGNPTTMPRPTHYSPAIDRFLVCVLYHEAKRRKQPMTAVANALLKDALKDTEGWRIAEESNGRYKVNGDSPEG